MTEKAKQSGNEYAHPLIEINVHSGEPCNQHFGLTRREYFAAMAMQGSICNGDSCYDIIARDAVAYADALLEELSKTEQI